MRTYLLIPFLIACGSEKSKSTPAQGSSCTPDPAIDGRFAVGVVPAYRVSGLGEAPKCYDEFVPTKILDASGKLVAEGRFEGHCPGETEPRRTFESVAVAKVSIATSATHEGLGKLGPGDITLALAHPEWLVGVTATPQDRCGLPLDIGTSRDLTTWTLGPACANVAKLVYFGDNLTKSREVQLAPVGVGTCTLEVEMLGAKSSATITVK